MVLFFNTICSLQQLAMFFIDIFSLVLVCNDIEPSHELLFNCEDSYL